MSSYRLKIPVVRDKGEATDILKQLIDKIEKTEAPVEKPPTKPGVQAQLPSRALAQLPSLALTPTEETIPTDLSVVGVILVVVYFLMFIYIYGSARQKGYLTMSLTDNYGMTTSEAFQYSEKIGSTILIVTMIGLMIGMLIEKGFVTGSSILKTSLISVSFVILLSFLLLFLIPLGKRHKTRTNIHIVLAGILIFFMIYSTYVFSILYQEVYESEGWLIHLENFSYTLTALAIAMLILFLYMMYSVNKFSGIKYNRISMGIAVLEFLIITIYGFVLGIVSTLPKLIDYEELCISIGYSTNDN